MSPIPFFQELIIESSHLINRIARFTFEVMIQSIRIHIDEQVTEEYHNHLPQED